MKGQFDLTEKIALVTGAGQGLGKEFARSLARAGASVYIMARNVPRAEAAAAEIHSETGAAMYAHFIDVTDEQSVMEAARFVQETTGRLDILVNNAALGRGVTPLQDTTLEEWNTTMNTNLNGTFLCMKHFGKMMIAQRSGCVINLASLGGKVCLKNCCTGAYDVSKAAVEGLTRCMAGEWAQYNIRVNSICPGYILTDINKAYIAEHGDFYDKSLDHIPTRVWGNPEQMGDIAVFLASDAASYVNGSNLVADGGYTIF